MVRLRWRQESIRRRKVTAGRTLQKLTGGDVAFGSCHASLVCSLDGLPLLVLANLQPELDQDNPGLHEESREPWAVLQEGLVLL